VEFQDRLEQRTGVHADEHGAVTEPFRDPDAAPGTDVAHQGAERGEDVDGTLVALALGERRESRDVDEGETAEHSHICIVPCAQVEAQFGVRGGSPTGMRTRSYDDAMINAARATSARRREAKSGVRS
jgi:hypothetical protein